MSKQSRYRVLPTLLLSCLTLTAGAGEWKVDTSFDAGTTPTLRGFGSCEVKYETHTDGKRKVSEAIFAATSASNAETVAGKFLYDLGRGAGVSFDKGIFTVPGGALAVARQGVVTRLISAPDAATLRDWVDSQSGLAETLVEKATCPAWMSRFGWGTYGMGGLERFHGWMYNACKDPKKQLDPRDDYDFHRQMGNIHFDAWLQLEEQDDTDGIVSPGVRWKTRYAEQVGVPYSFRFYMPCNGYSWMSRRFGEYMEQPAPWMVNGWLRYETAHQPHISWFNEDIWGYIGRKCIESMTAFKTPHVGGWMHPAGELLHQPWYDMHGDYSPSAQKDWQEFLKANGVTLAEVSAMYSLDAKDAFVDWSQVQPPEFATFAGLPGRVLDLAGTWLSSSNRTDWSSIDMPGNLEWFEYYNLHGHLGDQETRMRTPRYVKRTFNWDPALAAGKRVYLYFFPMSDMRVRHTVTLNGEKVSDVGTWCALDVTDRLRLGGNELELLLHGFFWNGRIFLSTQEPAVYPNLGAARNKLFALWNDWRRDAKKRRCEQIFDAMRQADPDAPIKFMAPQNFGVPIINKMFTEWGAFAHFTGEGIWYYPWYKRYSRLWGLQGTSELAGPYNTVADARKSSLRVFLAGLDLHQPVFLTQVYSRNPPVREWWLQHKEMLGRLGTYEIDGPQILVYRRSLVSLDDFPAPEPLVGAKGHEIQTPWDWDLGRGVMQTLGQSVLYIDDDGIEANKMRGYQVMVDSGNEVYDPACIKGIADWVKEGGTFIAWPFSGRSTRTESDTWPIATLAGAKATKIRPLGGTVTWKGHEYADNGRTIACNGLNFNAYSVELEPTDSATEVVAKYENGAAAITVRKLGKGRVIWLGSAFARDSADLEGIWWPSKGEVAFWKELLADIGAVPAVCTTDDALIWAQPYRSHDGLDAVTVLCNFNTNGVQKTLVTLRVPRKPATIVTWSERGEEHPAFKYDAKSGTCTFTAEITAQEIMVANARVYEPSDAVAYWWKENQVAWRPLRKPTMDFTKYAEGKWRDPTMDLKEGWTFADTGKPCAADVLQFWGLPDGQPAKIVKTFDLDDPTWMNGGMTRFTCGAWGGPNFDAKAKITLNGTVLCEKAKSHDRITVDVTHLLKAKGNVMEMEFDKPDNNEEFTGFNGALYLFHRPAPVKEMVLAGLPAKQFIPKDWEDKYRVFIHMESKVGDRVRVPLGVSSANARYMRRHHHRFGNVTDVDITSILRFGEENELKPYDPNIREPFDFSKIEVRLQLYPLDAVR